MSTRLNTIYICLITRRIFFLVSTPRWDTILYMTLSWWASLIQYNENETSQMLFVAYVMLFRMLCWLLHNDINSLLGNYARFFSVWKDCEIFFNPINSKEETFIRWPYVAKVKWQYYRSKVMKSKISNSEDIL